MARRVHATGIVHDFEVMLPALPRYPFSMDAHAGAWTRRRFTGAAMIAALLVALAVLTLLTPATNLEAHNILHHMNFLPLMLAGMFFGWRGALAAALFAASVQLPLLVHNWETWPLDAKDQIVELTIFSAAGLIAGYLSDQERAQRQSLEKTRQELESVYLELRSHVAEMKKAERLTAAGRLAASLAHEIRNPLASISGAAGILQRGTAPPEFVDDSLDIIQKESQRLNKLLTNFLNFAKPRSPRLRLTDLDELVESVLSLTAPMAEQRRVRLTQVHANGSAEAACDSEQIRQVLLNLVLNAVEASPEGAEICVGVERGAERIAINVEDAGSGIPEEAVDHIFDPFFTTKTHGTGLGLAISSTIVSQHNGTLSFHRNERGGTTFRIDLPMSQEHVHAE
ncbi:MAG TPA: ATP-binding protein [Terracidiphilus sp.]